MLPLTDVILPAASFATMLAGLMKWLASDHGAADDEDVVLCHGFVMDCLSDADLMRTLGAVTDRDLRGQLTVEQILDLQREVALRQQKGRN